MDEVPSFPEDTFFKLTCASRCTCDVPLWQEIEFVIDKDSYGRMNEVEFGVKGPNENSTNYIINPLEQLQGTHGEAKKDVLPLNHICGVLARYKYVLTNELSQKVTTKWKKTLLKKDWAIKLYDDKWSWKTKMRRVKAIQEGKWPLTQKGLGQTNYYHRFIWDFFKVARTLSNLLNKWLSW